MFRNMKYLFELFFFEVIENDTVHVFPLGKLHICFHTKSMGCFFNDKRNLKTSERFERIKRALNNKCH